MAYFPVFIDLSGKHVLVIGGGAVAERRIRTLLEFGCRITIAAPNLCAGLQTLVNETRNEPDRLIWKEKKYETADLETDAVETPVFVLAAADRAVNARVVLDCREKKIPVNDASDRDQCDFYFPGIAKDGETVVGITSGGSDHKKAARISGKIRELLSSLSHSGEEHGKLDVVEV